MHGMISVATILSRRSDKSVSKTVVFETADVEMGQNDGRVFAARRPPCLRKNVAVAKKIRLIV
jgi:hypothetical protein